MFTLFMYSYYNLQTKYAFHVKSKTSSLKNIPTAELQSNELKPPHR